MKVSDVMRKDFIAFQADDTLGYVVKKFVKNKITSAPVFDNGDFIGIVDDAQIVKYFLPKKFLGIWKKSEPNPDEIRKILVTKFLRRPRVVLKPEQELNKVLKRIVREMNCIPVVEKKKVVGIIRSEDVNKVFLKGFAKSDMAKPAKGKKKKQVRMDTEIDTIVSRVEKEGKISSHKLAKELGISVKAVEKLAECLARNQIIEIGYPLFRGIELRRKKREEEK